MSLVRISWKFTCSFGLLFSFGLFWFWFLVFAFFWGGGFNLKRLVRLYIYLVFFLVSINWELIDSKKEMPMFLHIAFMNVRARVRCVKNCVFITTNCKQIAKVNQYAWNSHEIQTVCDKKTSTICTFCFKSVFFAGWFF